MSIISRPTDPGMAWMVTTPATVYPITAAEVRAYARIDGSSEESFIDGLIQAITLSAEKYLDRALLEQTITMHLDSWPESDAIEIPRPPLLSVSGVYTVDEEGTETEYGSSYYYVETQREPGRLVLKYGMTAPINTERYRGGYIIRAKVGYGSTASSVPQAIRTGLTAWVSRAYEDRLPTEDPPSDAAVILWPYRRLAI